MTIAITTGHGGAYARRATSSTTSAPSPRSPRRRRIKRILLVVAVTVTTLVAAAGAWAGVSIYRIDHAVHHVGLPASLLAKGKNDLLAIVQGPDHKEQVFVFHATAGHTHVLQVPEGLALPLRDGQKVPLDSLSIHSPAAIVTGLDRLGIPVSHYVGVDLHMVDPTSDLGRLATGKLSVTSMISNPLGTSALLGQVASHMYLGPGTPVSDVLSLMDVPTAHPVTVPTDRDGHGELVLAAAFADVLRAFL